MYKLNEKKGSGLRRSHLSFIIRPATTLFTSQYSQKYQFFTLYTILFFFLSSFFFFFVCVSLHRTSMRQISLPSCQK